MYRTLQWPWKRPSGQNRQGEHSLLLLLNIRPKAGKVKLTRITSPQERSPCSSPVLAECRRLLRSTFQGWNGHEVDTQGDAFFIAFARATDAVTAAVEVQRALAAHPWPEGAAARIRMSLHTGEPTLTPEGYV